MNVEIVPDEERHNEFTRRAAIMDLLTAGKTVRLTEFDRPIDDLRVALVASAKVRGYTISTAVRDGALIVWRKDA